MGALDHWLAGNAHGAPVLVVVGVAILLGLRHASDPDHLAAVTSLIAGERERRVRRAGSLGLAWGLGHATTLALFGLPVVLWGRDLPNPVRQGAEIGVGFVVCVLAVRLLRRWRAGAFHAHVHRHDDGQVHRHLHAHERETGHVHAHAPLRSPAGAYGIGLLHGVGGSAGVGILLLASIHDRSLAAGCLLVFAAFTAVSMALLSTCFGYAIVRGPLGRSFDRLVPVLGAAGLAFGCWYAAAAVL